MIFLHRMLLAAETEFVGSCGDNQIADQNYGVSNVHDIKINILAVKLKCCTSTSRGVAVECNPGPWK